MDSADLGKQLDALRELAARSINPCVTSQFIAFADARVRDLLLKKVADGNVFRGVSCLDTISIPENRYVYFDFDCPPDTLCIVKPAFVAVVSLVSGYVVAIVDPFVRSGQPDFATLQLRPQRTITHEAEAWIVSGDGTLPLGGGTLPLGDGTLPLRMTGYRLVPEWGVRGG